MGKVEEVKMPWLLVSVLGYKKYPENGLLTLTVYALMSGVADACTEDECDLCAVCSAHNTHKKRELYKYGNCKLTSTDIVWFVKG